MLLNGKSSIINKILWKCVVLMRDLLKTCYGITDAALAEDLVKAGKLETFPKGSIIVEAGKEQHYVPILLEGVTRGYLIDADGTDITDCFSYRRGDILLGCNQLASPSYVNIEAITAVKCITIPVSVILEMQGRFSELTEVYNRLLMAAMDRHWEIKMLLYRCTAMERYQWFMSHYADIASIVSNRYIASFLGMTPVTLSRLRRKLREVDNL